MSHDLDLESKKDMSVIDARTGSETPESHLVIDKSEERRLLRKLDWSLLPCLAIMYLCNALDKGNLGNALTDGLDKDLHLVGNQYYLIVMVFYVPLCLCGTPISLWIKRWSAARVLPLMMLGFGSMAMINAAAKNFGELFFIRIILGICESAMLPGVVFYLSSFYTRTELASRIGIFYSAAQISGAFSGLISYGVFQVNSPKIKGWQMLFIIEGGFTIIFATIAFFFLPLRPETHWILTPREKELCRIRILRNSSSVINEKLNVGDAFRPFVQDWRYIIWALLSLGLGVPLAGIGNFLPQIVARLGYNKVKTNLLTVAPNIVGALCVILFTQSSDYFRERSFHITFALLVTMIGFVILGTIDVLSHKAVAYFACFLLSAGSASPSVLTSTWYNNNSPSENKRVVLTAVMVGIANSSGLISSNVFRAQDAPKYIPALSVSAAFGGATALLAFSWGMYMRYENKRRNLAQGVNHTALDVPTEILGKGHADPRFRYFL
ncbi:MFS general substrate transporter [Meredithblackwellia eburnea MCA 4105]